MCLSINYRTISKFVKCVNWLFTIEAIIIHLQYFNILVRVMMEYTAC